MRTPTESLTWQDTAVLLLIAALCFGLYPFFSWWTLKVPPWYLIYLVWALIILLAFVLERCFRNHDV